MIEKGGRGVGIWCVSGIQEGCGGCVFLERGCEATRTTMGPWRGLNCNAKRVRKGVSRRTSLIREDGTERETVKRPKTTKPPDPMPQRGR